MLIEIRNKLVIDITDDLLKQIVIAELTCDNPEYIAAKKAGRSTRGILPLIKNFSIHNGKYLLPRGYLSRLYTVMYELGLDIQLKDFRSVVPLETKYNHTISLRDYQIEALTNLSRNTEGVLVSPAGSGKTVMGTAAILMCGQKSLWITHTKQLLFQFIDRFTSFVDIPKEDVGLIYEGNWVTDKPITAALIQTLRSDKDKLAAIANNFGTIIVDECLVAGTRIGLLDGTEKCIEDIKNEDITTYGKVSNKFSRKTDKTVVLRTNVGEIEGTFTHVLPYISANKEKVGLENKLVPFKEEDVVFEKMENISEKDYVLSVETLPHVVKNHIGVNKSRLLALIACDGHIQKDLRCLQIGVSKDVEWFAQELLNGTSDFEDNRIRISKCSRGDVIIRSYSKEAISFTNKYIPKGNKSKLIRVPKVIQEASLEEIKEYLQVVFDTEGSVTNQISITMSSKKFIEDIQFLLRKFGILGRIIPIHRNNYLRLALTGYDAFIFWKKIGFSIERKQQKLSELIKLTRRFRRVVRYKDVLYRCVPVINKSISFETKEVYDFTTEQHIFSANGILSSNCHHQPSDTFTEVVANLNPFYLYGLTATHERRDGLEILLFQNVGPVRHAVPRSAVASQTITPTIIKRSLDIPGIPEETTYHKLLQFLQENKYRNTIICNDVLEQARSGNICIVLTERVSHAELLFKNLKKLWPKTGCVHGKHTQKVRQQTLDALEAGEITVLVCTSQLLGEGFDYPPLNRLFLTLPIRDPSKCEQLVGRIQRTYPGKTDAYLFDYVDNHGLTKHQYQNFGTLGCRYNVYEKLGCIIK